MMVAIMWRPRDNLAKTEGSLVFARSTDSAATGSIQQPPNIE